MNCIKCNNKVGGIICDNDCKTIICDKCNIEYHYEGTTLKYGHSPNCGNFDDDSCDDHK
jgi:hypothetical protein